MQKKIAAAGFALAGLLLLIYAPYRYTDLIGGSLIWVSLRIKL